MGGEALADRADKLIIRRAAAVTWPEINTQAVILRELPSGEGRGIDFQRPLHFDDQDRRLGQDTYCVTLPSGPTVYGGLNAAEVQHSVLHLTLTDEAARDLGLTRDVFLRLEVSPEEFAAVIDGLRTVLGPEASGLLRIGDSG